MAHFSWLLEDGTGSWLLEDSGDWLLEDQTGVHGLTLSGTHATQALFLGPKRARLDHVEFTFLLKAGIIYKIKTRFKVISVLVRESLSHMKIKSSLLLPKHSSFKIKSALLSLREFKLHLNTHPRPRFFFSLTGTTNNEKLKKLYFKKLRELLDDDK